MAPELDTAGFLTRHPALWQTAAEVMYGDNITISNSYPSLVRTIDFPTTAETDGDALLMDFVANLTSFLNGTSEQWNITTEWAKTKPANTTDYEILLNITYPILIAKHEVQNLREPFYAEYAAVHDGRVPFIDPSPLTRWNWSDQYPLSAIDDARKNKTIFTDWFSDNVLVPDNETCSNSIMLYVGSEASTSYRNVYLDPPSVPYGFYTGYISPYWGGPDFVLPSKLECFFFFCFPYFRESPFPSLHVRCGMADNHDTHSVGVASYYSTITNHIEVLPVSVDIMAAKGCDGMLFGLIQDLVAAGMLQTPMAGYSGTTGGEVLFRRSVGL